MPKIAVIGDVMLDTYHYLDVVRSAPEGGLIHRINHTNYRPGAAANVADCLETLGWDVTLIAHSGNDPASKILQSWAFACDINTQWLPLSETQKTRENIRYYQNNTCLLRADMPNPTHFAWDSFSTERLLAMDAVVLYDKGSLEHIASDILAFCRLKGIKTYVDPCRSNLCYAGAYLIKANQMEYESIVKKHNSDNLKSANLWQHLIVTQDKNPLSYWDENNQHHQFPIDPCLNILDSVGAGDAFLSALITAEWESFTIPSSINVAKRAGALALQHIGTHAPTRAELMLPEKIRERSE